MVNNGEKPLISIIVPVYKVEPYLKKCIESIRSQTYQNLEIILIDDGSPDRCGQICDEYAQIDKRIQVIHQENAGLSAARNRGLEQAKGKYVGFVDSDDWVYPKMYERLFCLLQDTQADIAQCGVVTDNTKEFPENIEITVYTGSEIFAKAVQGKMAWTVWCNLYRSTLWKTLKYAEGYYYEDTLIFPQLLKQNPKWVITNERLYFYLRREEGIVRSEKNMLHIISKEKVYEVYEKLLSEIPGSKEWIAFYICKNIPAYRGIVRENKYISQKQAQEHNKKMQKLFLKYYKLAQTCSGYYEEPVLKRLMWRVYALSPHLAQILTSIIWNRK